MFLQIGMNAKKMVAINFKKNWKKNISPIYLDDQDSNLLASS